MTLGERRPRLHPAGPGLQNDMQGEGSLKASRATKGQLNRLQNKEGHRPPKAQIAAVMGVAGGQWGPQLRPRTLLPPPCWVSGPDLKAPILGFHQQKLLFLSPTPSGICDVDVGATVWLRDCPLPTPATEALAWSAAKGRTVPAEGPAGSSPHPSPTESRVRPLQRGRRLTLGLTGSRLQLECVSPRVSEPTSPCSSRSSTIIF